MDVGKPPPLPGRDDAVGTPRDPFAFEARYSLVNSLKWMLASERVTTIDSTVTVVEKDVYQKPADLNPAFDPATTERSRSRLVQ